MSSEPDDKIWLSFVQADYGDPAWVSQVTAHAPFDAIVSGFSIHHQPDERKRPF